jgi:hypothetical protein
MHYSPDSTRLVYTGNQGTSLPRTIVVRDRDGREVTVGEGRSPCWLESDIVQAVGPDANGNTLIWGMPPTWQAVPAVPYPQPGGNQHTAAVGRWAVGLTDPRRILTSWGLTIPQGAEPALSPDGTLFAYVIVAESGPHRLMVESTWLGTEPRELATGQFIDLRFGWGATCLTWGTQDGRIFGIAGVGNFRATVEELGYRGFRCGWPRALWDGERLWIALAADLGNSSRIILAEWDSAARGEHSGFVVADSTGSGFDLAVAA